MVGFKRERTEQKNIYSTALAGKPLIDDDTADWERRNLKGIEPSFEMIARDILKPEPPKHHAEKSYGQLGVDNVLKGRYGRLDILVFRAMKVRTWYYREAEDFKVVKRLLEPYSDEIRARLHDRMVMCVCGPTKPELIAALPGSREYVRKLGWHSYHEVGALAIPITIVHGIAI